MKILKWDINFPMPEKQKNNQILYQWLKGPKELWIGTGVTNVLKPSKFK